MTRNNETTTNPNRMNGLDFVAQQQQQQQIPQPMTKTNQPANPMEAKLALMKRQNELILERQMGLVAAFTGLVPIVQAATGDPNARLEILADVIKTRGCDAAGCRIEIIIEDDE